MTFERSVMIVGLIVSLSLGFLDSLNAFLAAPSTLSSAVVAFVPTGITILVCLVVYLLIWKLIPTRFKRKDLFGLFRRSRIVRTVGFALPILLAETAAFVWFCIYRLDSFSSPAFALALGSGLAAMFLTVFVAYRSTVSRVPLWPLVSCLILVLLGGVVSLSRDRGEIPEVSADNPSRIRHVVLITVDTLRPDFLSCYGSDRSTPHIDALAADGVHFANALSPASWTKPALASMMTGVHPEVHGAMSPEARLSDRFETLAEIMSADGYLTAAFVRNPFLDPQFNLSQGFLEYRMAARAGYFDIPSFGGTVLGGVRLIVDAGRLTVPMVLDRRRMWTPFITGLAGEWMARNRERDFFVWIHYLDPHLPYMPPDEHLPSEPAPSGLGASFGLEGELDSIRSGTFVPSPGEMEWIRKLYAGEVAHVDDNIGSLRDRLEQLDIYDDALILLSSDHGEEFWEHGGYEHGHTLYGEVVRVPLLVKLPGSSSRKIVETTVSTQRVMSTILDLCEVEGDGGRPGHDSLRPLWGPDAESVEDDAIFLAGLLYDDDRHAVVFDGMKYVRFPMSGREELYDLERDRGELRTVAPGSPDIIRRARALLEGHGAEVEETRQLLGVVDEPPHELDPRTVKLLKSLGYIQ